MTRTGWRVTWILFIVFQSVQILLLQLNGETESTTNTWKRTKSAMPHLWSSPVPSFASTNGEGCVTDFIFFLYQPIQIQIFLQKSHVKKCTYVHTCTRKEKTTEWKQPQPSFVTFNLFIFFWSYRQGRLAHLSLSLQRNTFSTLKFHLRSFFLPHIHFLLSPR